MVKLSATNYKTGESVDFGKYRNYKCAAEAILNDVVWDEDDIPGHWHFDISVDDGRTGYEELSAVPIIGVMCTLDDFMNEPKDDEDFDDFEDDMDEAYSPLWDDEGEDDEDEDEEDEEDFEDDVDETNYDPYMGCDFWDDGSSFEGWD